MKEQLTIIKRANELRNNEEILVKQMEQRDKEKYYTEQAKLVIEFETAFQEVLNMLQEAGISYSAHYQDPRFPFKGKFIQFQKDGKFLKMDFENSLSYRYEYSDYNLTENSIALGSMTYGLWPMNGFIIWIANWLEENFDLYGKEVQDA